MFLIMKLIPMVIFILKIYTQDVKIILPSKYEYLLK